MDAITDLDKPLNHKSVDDSLHDSKKPRSMAEMNARPTAVIDSNSQRPALTMADLRSTFATNLAPKSGPLLSQTFIRTNQAPQNIAVPPKKVGMNALDIVPDVAQSTQDMIESRPTTAPSSHSSSPPGLGPSTPSNTSVAFIKPALGRPPSANKVKPTYVLPDGSVTNSGKGLGRGRPGIKRGPRKSKLSTEIIVDDPTEPSFTTASSNSTTAMSPPVTTPVPASKKRKWSDSAASEEIHSRSISSTPEYNPQSTQTRSGRQSQKPISFVLPTSLSPSQQVTATSVATTSPTSSALASKKGRLDAPIVHPKIKRRIYRGRESLALCEHCLRGSGPPRNVIVFCDACNRCWHQKCHTPQIPKEIVSDKNAQWICYDCDLILHPTKKPSTKKGKKGRPPKHSPLPSHIEPLTPTTTTTFTSFPSTLVPGSLLTRAQRITHLTSLPKDRLIDLLMRASDLAPTLPLFVPPKPEKPVVVVDEGFESAADAEPDQEEEEWEYILDENAMLYPKPGSGVQLPPDAVDLHILLEGKDCKTFSHWVRRPGQEYPF